MDRLRFERTVNANLQNRINKSIVFHHLREHGGSYRARIAKDLNLSAPAVSRAVESLIQEGYVFEADKLITGSGKRPTQLQINTQKGIVVAVDLIKNTIELAIADFGGHLVQKNHGFRISGDTDVYRSLANEIDKSLRIFGASIEEGKTVPEVRAIGIGVPAITDRDSGTVVGAPLYGSLQGVDLKNRLEVRFGVPVYVENVVRLSALGEKSNGYGRNYASLVFVEVSNGIGAGIIIDNRLVRGSFGAAGEIGLCPVGKEGLAFRVLRKGFLETRASVESIAEKALMAMRSGTYTLLARRAGGDRAIDAAAVCRAAAEGDALSTDIVQEIVETLAVAVINVSLVLNPELIVFGGDICNLPHVGDLFVNPIKSIVRDFLPFTAPEIVLSSLGEDAGVIGAAIFAVESLLVNEFPYSVDIGIRPD